MSQAVDFINNKLQYRFIDLDISVTLTFQDSDFLFIPGFQSTSSIAHLNVPRDYFAALFYYSIQYADMTNNDYTKMKYAMDASGWYNAPYSKAIVDASYQINTGSLFQNVKYDYIRHVLKQITGNNASNGLFRNTDALLSTVVSMDTQFNSQILAILATCGTIASPKTSTFYNNPGRVLIDSILANDNVIETDNEERRAALLSKISANVTTDYNNNKAYYVIGTKEGEFIEYCYFPIYINANIATTPIHFKEYPDYTFYTSSPATYSNFETIKNTPYYIHSVRVGGSASVLYYYPLYLSPQTENSIAYTFTDCANITFYSDALLNSSSAPAYANITANNNAYYINATKSETAVRFPMYLNSGVGRQLVGKFDEYDISFYTSYAVYDNSFISNDTNGTYLNGTRTGTNVTQDYRVYMNNTAKNPITFNEYPGTTFYTDCRKYDSSPGYVYATKTGDSINKYYVISDVSGGLYTIAITFTAIYTGTYYTNSLTGLGSVPVGKVPYDGFYLYATPLYSTATQYYPVYIAQTGVYITAIKFVEYPGKTFYTDYINYYSDTAYYVNTTYSFGTTNYYPIYLNSTSAHSTLVQFIVDASLNGLNFYTSTIQYNNVVPTGYLNLEIPHYIKSDKYNYPVYATKGGTHDTQVGTLPCYRGTTMQSSSYDNFAFTNYNPTIPYYITGTKTGTTVSDTYFPIYVNYAGHSCSTPITFTDYPGLTFYTNYETVDTFYPFTFEYGDSLSVRVTYKPKYNTYLGREIKDYSYQIYLDMGIEQNTTRYYTVTGDENPSGTVVGQITHYDATIYTSLGVQKVFHYVLQNANLPSLYDSSYNFYPTLNDISNVSFDVSSNVAGRWFFSVFCRPRTNGEYDSVGFDRFDTENVANIGSWTSYNINTLKWTNGTASNLSWQNVLDLSIDATTTPYGNIKANSQQQIMVLAIGTDTVSYGGSIRNVSVEFKDGRIITMS